MISKGTWVVVEPTNYDLRKSYPAADWIKCPTVVLLLDDAPADGTLDVLDVQTQIGEELSIYDFNVRRENDGNAELVG